MPHLFQWKPRASVGPAARSRAQGRALTAVRCTVSLRAALVCLPEVGAAEHLERPTAARRDRDGDGEEAGPCFSGVCLPWLLCLYCPGMPHSALLIQPHAGHRLGLGCWNGTRQPPKQQKHSEGGQHSTYPPLRGALPSKGRARDLSVGATEKERGKWSLNRAALVYPYSAPAARYQSAE